VAILGTPCGGTKYAKEVFRAAGLDVGHEADMGEDGLACGFITWAGPVLGRKHRLDNYQWEHIVHLVRHPLGTAETLPAFVADIPRGPWHHEDPVLRALRYWVLTHRKIMGRPEYRRDMVLRLDREHFASDWERIRQRMGLELTDPPPSTESSKDYRWDRLTWDEWKQRDFEFARDGLQLIRKWELNEPPETRRGKD
jgi:hypothetical protein